jgi:Flp pilus assembly protein TadD
LGDYYLLSGDAEKALLLVDKALEGLPHNSDLYNSKAALLIQKKDMAEAEIAMKKAISLKHDNAYFHVNLGVIYLRSGRYDAAIREAKRAILLDGNSQGAYWLMSEAFKAENDHSTADHFSRVASGSVLTKKRCP